MGLFSRDAEDQDAIDGAYEADIAGSPINLGDLEKGEAEVISFFATKDGEPCAVLYGPEAWGSPRFGGGYDPIFRYRLVKVPADCGQLKQGQIVAISRGRLTVQ